MKQGNNIRDALKAAFPQMRFSVRKWRSSWRGTMWIVRWRLGPSVEVVTRVAGAAVTTAGDLLLYDRIEEDDEVQP
jgi:hypothetical protein